MTTYLLSATRSYCSSYSGLSKACWQGIGLTFVESTFIGVYYFLSLYFVNELHFTIATAGVIISCYGTGTILGGLMGGKLSDKLSPRLVSIGSLFMQAFAFLLLIKLRTIHFLMLNVFTLGVASYVFITSNYVWVLQQCSNNESDRLKALNILATASNLGLGLSAIIVSSLMRYGFSYILSLSGVFLLLTAFYSVSLERKRNEKGIEECNKENTNNQKKPDSGKANSIIFCLVLGCVFLVGLIIAQLSSTYSIYLEHAFPQFGVNGMGILFSLNSFLVVIFGTPVGNYIGRYNKVLMVGVGAFLLGFGMFMLNYDFEFILAILSCVVYSTGEILFFSVAQLVCYQKGGEKNKGRSMGIYRMIYASSRVLGPAGGGFIYQHFGPRMLWYLCGAIGLICITACGYFKQYE